MRVLLLAASAYALDALHALLDSHSRGLRKVAVAHTSYGRGLVATCAVAKDEACLRIPYELCAVEPEASADVGHWASRMANRVVRDDLQPAHKACLPPPPDVLLSLPRGRDSSWSLIMILFPPDRNISYLNDLELGRVEEPQDLGQPQ